MNLARQGDEENCCARFTVPGFSPVIWGIPLTLPFSKIPQTEKIVSDFLASAGGHAIRAEIVNKKKSPLIFFL